MSFAERTIDELIAMLGDTHLLWESRREIADVLGTRGDVALAPLLSALTQRADIDLRRFAALALGRLGNRQAITPLLDVLGQPGYVDDEISEALSHFGTAIFPRLMVAFHTGTARVRQNAALALGYLGDGRAVEPLVRALRDQDNGVRWYSARALGLLGDTRAVEPLLTTFTAAALTFDDEVVYAAITSLGQLDDQRAIPVLLGSLSDRKDYIRCASATALGAIGATQAIPFLIRLLDDTDEYTSVAYDVALALRHMGSPTIVPLLTALTHSGGDGDLRAGILWALDGVDDERVTRALEEVQRSDVTRTRTGNNVAEMAADMLSRGGDDRTRT